MRTPWRADLQIRSRRTSSSDDYSPCHKRTKVAPQPLDLVTSQPQMARTRANEFEKAFQQLEKIVQRLESEELPLDESLQLFEEGIRLSRFCNQKLEEVEKKIELILADAKGQPSTEPFEPEEIDGEASSDEEPAES